MLRAIWTVHIQLERFQRGRVLAAGLGHSCDILAKTKTRHTNKQTNKHVTTVYPSLKDLPEAKLKNFALISLAKQILRQPGIDSVAC